MTDDATISSERSAQIFGEGCDSRLCGLPLWENPYREGINCREYTAWRRGWKDVNRHWGEDNPLRARRLVAIRESIRR